MVRRALAFCVSAVVLGAAPACAALPSGATPQAPTVAPAASADGVTRVRLDHRSGADQAAPVVMVPRGGTVELVVGSDTAERVVVSGIDQVRYVTAGGTVTMRFVATTPADVRLGESGTELGRLDVR
ncbi:hypothetical protein [Pseudonocardia endophytica]|uniref:Uncharacterized protein n=1 Tax=Pseudonocardia endophytica TaxID=401976 RepID=A0A4R1I1M6_PSEEN|nr:hypothetical protein [Pseudonocardia endophytica]TCK27140.1 hypothetical protein EV378_2999 [Pseudonocardia endophytica]